MIASGSGLVATSWTPRHDGRKRPSACQMLGARRMNQAWNKALTHLRSALSLLDESKAPLEIGAHLDFTIGRLEDAITARTRASVGANSTGHAGASVDLDHT